MTKSTAGQIDFNCRTITLIILAMLYFFIPGNPARAQQGHANCFVYHRFGDERYPSTNISSSGFRQQLEYLKENNFHVLSLGEVVALMSRHTAIPPQTVVLTIDDGYLSFYENGLPLLEAYHFKASLFINTANVGDAGYMDWDMIRDARERGIEIGNHSHAHTAFLDIHEGERKEAFRQDLARSEALFMENLGEIPRIYSYPYGEYDSMMQEILGNLDYVAAAAQYSGVLYPGSDLYALPRFPMGGPFASLDGFRQKSGMLPLEIISEKPLSILMDENPPTLEIILNKGRIRADQLQCFVDGKPDGEMHIREEGRQLILQIRSKKPLQGRRSIYTITAPSSDGKYWCWYSRVWVNDHIAN